MKRKDSGFSLIELVVALAILAVAAVFVARTTTARIDAKRVEVTRADMQEILEGAMNYYIQNHAWPGSISVMQSAGDLPNVAIIGAWDDGFSVGTAGGGNQFQVGTTVSNAAFASEIAGGLPFGTATGATVTGAVVIPGEEVALNAYLPRDGHLPMTGTLQMNGNNIVGINAAEGSEFVASYAVESSNYMYAASYMQAPTMYSSTIETTNIHTTNSYASNLLYSSNAIEAMGYMYAPAYYGTGWKYYVQPSSLSYIDNIDIAGNNSYTYANGMNNHDCFGSSDGAGCSISQALFYATMVGSNIGDSTENPCGTEAAQVFQFPMSLASNTGSPLSGFGVGVTVSPSQITVTGSVNDTTSAKDTDVDGDYGLLIRCPQ